MCHDTYVESEGAESESCERSLDRFVRSPATDRRIQIDLPVVGFLLSGSVDLAAVVVDSPRVKYSPQRPGEFAEALRVRLVFGLLIILIFVNLIAR